MKICLFSRTPMAAAPWELFKALRRYTNHTVNLVNVSHSYRDGRVFPYHLLFRSDNGTARKALRNADVWHVNNYLMVELKAMRRSHKVLGQFHSLPRLGNWQDLMRFSDACYTITQPNQEKEYRLPGLPNIIDPDEYIPVKRGAKIRIAFAPSSRAPVGRPMSKGYSEVKAVLNEIALERDVEIEWIEGMPYKENLERKARAHILIDDVVTGNWHRTALEGACFACAVMSSYKCHHFYHSEINRLKSDLFELIDFPVIRKEYQERSRLWVLHDWHAIDKVKEYTDAYRRLLG